MLRLLVLVLLLLNTGYFAWAQGWFLPLGWGPTVQREPQRLKQQVRPEALVVLAKQESTAKAEAAAANTVCLQSALLDETQANGVRRVLQASLKEGTWAMESLPLSERWIIYMGKYANAAELAKKRAQLANLRLTFEPLDSPALTPGLSLGAYPSQAQATAALDALVLRGVRTARVLQELPARPGYRLRLPAVDEALQKQLTPVRAALPGKFLVNCSTP